MVYIKGQVTGPVSTSEGNYQARLERGVNLVGTVRDGATTVAGAMVRVSGSTIGLRSADRTTVKTDTNGHFEVRNLSVPDPDAAWWQYSVAVEKPQNLDMPQYLFDITSDDGTRTLDLNSQDARATSNPQSIRRNVNLCVNPSFMGNIPIGTASLHGTVEGVDGLSSRTVLKVAVFDDADFYKSADVRNGRFELNELPAGDYTVICDTFIARKRTGELIFKPVNATLRDGQLHTVVMRPGSAGVRGQVVGLKAGGGYILEIFDIDSDFQWNSSNTKLVCTKVLEGNAFDFLGLPPGDYYAEVSRKHDRGVARFTCRENETALCTVAMQEQMAISGLVYESRTSTALAGAKVSISHIEPGSNSRDSASVIQTDSDGRYIALVTTGTYSIRVDSYGKAWSQYRRVEVHEDQTELPSIDVSSQHGGIVISQTGQSEEVLWRAAYFDLIEIDSKDVARRSGMVYTTSIQDEKTAILQRVEAGRYGLVVRYEYDFEGIDKPFATAYIPDVEVKPGMFTMIDLPLDPAPSVRLVCEPGEEAVSWNDPVFWLEDSAGQQIPMTLTSGFDVKQGLAPGRYKFGVTLDSGEKQSVDFEVSADEVSKEVRLTLK